MSNIDKFDIHLHGHLVKDTIINKNLFVTTRLGGIANVWRSIKLIDNSINVSFRPTFYGECLVYQDYDNSDKPAAPILNIVKPYSEIAVNGQGIAYLGYLDQFECDVVKTGGCVIADVASNKEISESLLKKINFFLVSKKHINDKNLRVLLDSKIPIIIHSKEEVEWLSYAESLKFKTPKTIDRCNVLGAGDHFAASILCHLANFKSKRVSDLSVGPMIESAQESTYNYLLTNQ